jgi:ankyrin repeat protein
MDCTMHVGREVTLACRAIEERASVEALRFAVAALPGGYFLLLSYAVQQGNAEAASVLIEAGALVDDTQDGTGITALMRAANGGHIACLQLLLSCNADVDLASCEGATALQRACANGHAGCVKVLLAAKATVDQPDSNFRTPLMIGSGEGHATCVALLLAAKAVVDQANDRGETALLRACLFNHTESARMLIGAGANVNHSATLGLTALMLTCAESHFECTRLLLEASATVDQANESGITALFAACSHGCVDCAQLLSSYGANRSWLLQGLPLTAELVTIDQRHEDLVNWLRISARWTPLHHIEVLTHDRTRSLLRAGADLHATLDSSTPSPLERACKMWPPTAASELVRRAALPWSVQTHDLFPSGARARAVELVRIVHQLGAQRFMGEFQSLVDAWRSHVIPHAIDRAVGVESVSHSS